MGGETGVPAIPGCRSLSLLGERSASTVYAADSDRFGGAVTVTVYAKPVDEPARQEFEAAVAAAQRLGAHPHLITVHDSGYTGDGRPYVITDGHERTTAEGVLATSGVLAIERVLRIGVALAGALETAHRAGVVHCGVAPGLILLGSDGQPILTETGLARVGQPVGASAALARWIPYHAPPEVLEATEVSAATDVYSLASVIYTLLAGRPPHAGDGVDDSTASLLLRILQMPVPPIERPDVGPQLEDALRTALAHSPAKRPQHALELGWAFQEAQRAAGLAVTDPVVLDLGPATGTAGAPSAAGAPAVTEATGAPGPPGAPGVTGPGGAAAGDRPDWSWLSAVPTATPGIHEPGRGDGSGAAPAPSAGTEAPERPGAAGWELGGPGRPGGPTPGSSLVPLGDQAAAASGLSFASPAGHVPGSTGGAVPPADDPSGATGNGLPAPWWAAAGAPPASSSFAGPSRGPADLLALPASPSGAQEVDLGPLQRPPIDPAAERALNQPLPPIQRAPVDMSRLAGALDDPRRRPELPRPSVPQARQAPPLPRGGGSADRAGAAATAAAPPATPARAPAGDRASGGGGRRDASGAGPARATGEPLPLGRTDRPISALERARQARLERQRREREGSPAGDAPSGTSRAEPSARTRVGPPALPVIVLVALVVVLAIGGAWLVMAGEDAGPPASEQPAAGGPPGSADMSTPSTQAGLAGNRASGLTAVETADGVQLDWEGPVGISYLVRVLSPTAAPVLLGAGPATATLVPATMLDPGTPYCFDVISEPEPGVTLTVPDDPDAVVLPTVCIRGGVPQSMIRQ